jgi:bifunctional enzyme CysN/CysC
MDKEILKFATLGSVDDGKSTLIGRLLYETNSVYVDQYESIEKASSKKGWNEIDLSLITDGLKSEREQGITIDVAYRYFETDKRKFIVADGPGHVQYTKNAITGISNSDIAVILIDASNGITEQSRRHGFIVSLLNIRHILIVINKMDIVDYSRDVYDEVVVEYKSFLEKLGIADITFIPISALKGENVVKKNNEMEWYSGYTVLEYLENVYIEDNYNVVDFRFPVQMVLRPNSEFRGYAGRIVSGSISKGSEVVVLPSMRYSRVSKIFCYKDEVQEISNACVTLILEDDIDISRGDMIVKKDNIPSIDNVFEATICWMSKHSLDQNKDFILKHTTRMSKAKVTNLKYKVDIDTLHKKKIEKVEENDIIRVTISTINDIFFDCYNLNKNTGNFILIDQENGQTVACGFIKFGSNHNKLIRKGYGNINQDKGKVVWFTGLSGSGKSTIAQEVKDYLSFVNSKVVLLDGDILREGLCSDLGFSLEDRKENLRRVGELAKIFVENGFIVLCAFISPIQEDRDIIRNKFSYNKFIEVFVSCSIQECERRDVKGLYKKYREGLISDFTGFDSIYESPSNPEIIIDTEAMDIKTCVDKVIRRINEK